MSISNLIEGDIEYTVYAIYVILQYSLEKIRYLPRLKTLTISQIGTKHTLIFLYLDIMYIVY